MHIRLRRVGKTKAPTYRVVIADSRAPRNGKFIEAIGHYDPLRDSDNLVINPERAEPTLINGSRRKRIAAGSGTKVSDVNSLLKQFAEMQKVMKQMGSLAKGGRLPKIPGMRGL